MDMKENIQKLKLLNSMIEDFLDRMEMDEGEEEDEKSEKKPEDSKEK